MLAKLSTICHVMRHSERLTPNHTLKGITAVARLNMGPSGIIYLRVKAFIPLPSHNPDTDHSDPIEPVIEDFEDGNMIYIKGKFVSCDNYYMVNKQPIYLYMILSLLCLKEKKEKEAIKERKII